MTQIQYPSRIENSWPPRTTQARYTYDSMGRSNAVEWRANITGSESWSSIVSGVTYNAFGAVTSFNHLGQTETRQYNPLGQLTRITQGTAIDIEYRFSATANDGKILSQKNWRTGEDVTYQYDQLERLISASTTAGPQSWGLSWTYDGFGNRLAQNVTQGSGPAHAVLVNGNTNRISSAGFAYDLNGNLTQMPQSGGGSLNLNYDLSNRVASLSHNGGSEEYLYAPDNRRIWRSAGRTFCGASIDNDQQISWSPGTGFQNHYILYSPGGQKLGVYCLNFSPSGQYNVWTASEENVYWGSRLVAKRNGTSMGSFISDRLQSKGNGSAFFPYGESKTGAAGDDKEQFATYTRDEKSNLDYADQRWYSSGLGRFTSVDPYEASAVATNPQSWNRSSYVGSDPINYLDPFGLARCLTISWERDDNGNRHAEIECTSHGFTVTSRFNIPVFSDDPYQIARDAERSSIGTDLDQYELDTLLLDTYYQAQTMLQDNECAEIFGTSETRSSGWSPSLILGKLFFQKDQLGTIKYGSTLGATALTSPFIGGSGITATININQDHWRHPELNYDSAERARILLHELGHAFNVLSIRGSGGSMIKQLDAVIPAYQDFNNELIASRCGIVRPVAP